MVAGSLVVLETYTYTYDEAHNQTSKTETKGTTAYTYDELNRLGSVTEPSGKKTEYTYDESGNRATETVTENGSITVTNYIYNQQNRLTKTICESSDPAKSKDTTTYTFDNNGNVTYKTVEKVKRADPNNKAKFGMFISGQGPENEYNKGTAYFTYDELNRLVRTTTGSQTVECKYNGDGLRVEKSVNGVATKYLYEYDKVVLELDGSGKQTAKNVYGLNLVSRKVDNKTLYYMYNGHADVTALIDETGTVVASYDYDAFGVVLNEAANASNSYYNGNSYRYAGYQYDAELYEFPL